METVLVFGAGLVIGMAFFGGLKWTIQRLPQTRHPLALALGSFLVRIAVLLGALLLAGGGEWQRYIVILIGIFVARLAAVRLWGNVRYPGTAPSRVEGE